MSASVARATLVNDLPNATMLVVSPVLGSAVTVPFASEPNAAVKLTGVNLGRDVPGSPVFGASTIHSTLLPLNDAPGGGESWMLK